MIARILPLVMLLAVTLVPLDSYGQTAIRSDFDHDSTGFRLDGAHVVATCGECHSKGIFEGTLRECEDCHRYGSTVTATAKPARHVLTSERCVACHATRSFLPLERMDHAEAFGECSSCHNNRAAEGKPPDHPPAGDNCDACHLTSTFQAVLRFDHTGITSNCVSCHNGSTATGKTPNHLPTSDLCEDCHRTDTFSFVAFFDHTQALGTCSAVSYTHLTLPTNA